MSTDDLFCGSNDSYPTTEFIPKSRPWSSELLIGQLTKKEVKLPEDFIDQNKSIFWDNLCSEYDAENFCNFLKREDISLTEDFKAFEYIWRRDEYNHYLGFRHIYSILYGIEADKIVSDIGKRVINFEPIKDLLRDEFKVCLLLAYDEIATAKSYAQDFDLYELFGHPHFDKWIRLVTRDEAYHFNNCMEVIGKNFYHRKAEIPDLVNLFLEWDCSRNEYQGTFVLDHGNYSQEFLSKCGRIIKEYFK
jgi:hypothetical protein